MHAAEYYWSPKARRKRTAAFAESRLKLSAPIPKPRPLTPEELIDKYPCGWMCAPVRVPAKLVEALKRGKRNAAKAVKRKRYQRMMARVAP
jgi:hypothetical protein